MSKTKSNAKWLNLSPEAGTTLEMWLFDDQIAFSTALERAHAELGFTGSASSLRRFYHHTHQKRVLAGFVNTARLATSVNQTKVSADELRAATVKIAAHTLFQLVSHSPHNFKEWLPLARLVSDEARNQNWARVHDDANQLRRASLDFSRVRFQYDTVGAAMRMLPQLKALEEIQLEAAKDPKTRQFEENKRMNDLRRGMFGEAIPEILPENEEEEAHPEIIEQRYQEARKRMHEQWAKEAAERQKEHAEMRKRELAQAPTEATDVLPHPNDLEAVAQAQADKAAGRDPDLEPSAEFRDAPPQLTPEERQRQYEDLMRRAHDQGRFSGH